MAEILGAVFELVGYGIGASFWWLVKGRKTNWNDELLQHNGRNAVTGSLILVLVAAGIWFGFRAFQI